MKVLVKHFLNVRVGKPSVNAPSYQYLAPGSELEVDNKLYKGDKFETVDTWLKDAANNYYWSGGVTFSGDVEELLKHSLPASAPQQKFNWFTRLGIENIWLSHQEKGNAVTIAVLDTGYNSLVRDVSVGITQSKILIDAKNYPGIDLVLDDQSNDGHGTRCSAIVGARNTLSWLIGIAPECKLLNGKISINREVRNFDFILNGIDWAIKQGAEIISISYAVDLTEQQIGLWNTKLQAIIKNKNVLIFASTGNSGNVQRTADMYPASFDGCVSVGCVEENGALSSINVLSNKTILHAPGINIEAFGESGIPTPQSGTSFSAPIVAGIAGLAVSYIKKRNNNRWDSKVLLEQLFASGDTIPGHPSKRIINATKLFNLLENKIV